jgi:hypothetical protein
VITLTELNVHWPPGYENSSPVRIGNGAHQQVQLDVFGEIADAMYQTRKAGIEPPECAPPPPRGRRTKAFGRFAEGRSTSFIRRSWPGSHSIAPRMSWKRGRSETPVSRWREIADEFMPKSVSAVSTATS